MQFKRVLISGEAIVVMVDMCSSSDIFEELILRNDLSSFDKFITKLKHYLARSQEVVLFDPYKFTGDGWILLFPGNTDGALLCQFLRGLSEFYRDTSKSILLPRLDTRPTVHGLTFGVEKGRVAKMTIFQQPEYIGRPISVACRLQAAVKATTRNPAYKGLISAGAFQDCFAHTTNLKGSARNIPLRNVRGGRAFRCKLVSFSPNKIAPRH